MKKNMKLLISTINSPDQVIEIKKANLIFGRGENCDIILTDSLCSSRHCQLAIFDTYVEITDLDSKNGTFVNGEKITKTNLRFNQSFAIGNSTFIIYDKAIPNITSSIKILELESSLGENSDNFKKLPGNVSGKFNAYDKKASKKSNQNLINNFLSNKNNKYILCLFVLLILGLLKKLGVI